MPAASWAISTLPRLQTIPAGPREAARFIVCDKRSDINRVALTSAHVDQWKCDGEALARFVVEQLGLRRSRHRVDASGTRPLGLAAGDTRHQMLGLRTHGDVALVVADTAVALADLIDFDRGAYVLDTAAIRHLVDAATAADPRYTPSTTRREARTLDSQARYARWQQAYRALKQRRPQMSDLWYAGQIAKQAVAAGCHASTIRKHMTADGTTGVEAPSVGSGRLPQRGSRITSTVEQFVYPETV